MCTISVTTILLVLCNLKHGVYGLYKILYLLQRLIERKGRIVIEQWKTIDGHILEWEDATDVKNDESLTLHSLDGQIQIPNHFLSDLTYRECIKEQQEEEEDV